MKYKKFNYKKTPDYIQIETNIICNANCDFCTQKKVTRRPSIMENKTWKKIIDDTRGLGITYRPFLLNEPFTDERMLEICKYIKQDKTAKIEFNTNGSLLTKDISDELLSIGVDAVRFSIDGVIEEKYNQRRKGLDFKTVVKNTEYFCKKAKNYSTYTEVRMIDFPDSKEEHKPFKEKWSPLADQVLFTNLYSYPWEGQEEIVHKPCLKIKDEMFFYVDGRATLCCWDTAERAVIGDINNQKALEIWNGSTLKQYRDYLDNGERGKILLCSKCDAYKDFDFPLED
jgi:wyosine [tRNA(Phe)-imidazoG37] synthetase (radical SAM superfamily)